MLISYVVIGSIDYKIANSLTYKFTTLTDIEEIFVDSWESNFEGNLMFKQVSFNLFRL